MSTYFVTMPQLGESVTEGTISRWLVQPGDAVAELDAMVEITTDKVDAEIPAPVSGVVTAILAPEGAVVQIGGNIAVMEITATEHAPAHTASAAEKVAASQVTSTSTPGELETNVPESGSPAVMPEHRSSQGYQQAIGLSWDEIGPVASRSALEGDEHIRLTPLRRQIAQNMVLSKTTIPHAWQTQEVDMSGVKASVAAHRSEVRRRHGASLTYLPYVLAAAAASLRRHPAVNSTFAGDHVVLHREINLGVAVGLPEGVVVPVIRNADRLSVAELASAVADLTTRARAKKLATSHLAGATFTVNNSGALGTLLSYSVVPPGEAGILTMCAVVDRPVATDGRVEVLPMMYLCFSLDHRLMDGLQAAQFVGDCREWLERITSTSVLTPTPTL